MLQINMNQSFVFQISKISVLTVFRFFFQLRYWIDDINRKHCFAIKFETKKLNDKSRQFQENCQKIKAEARATPIRNTRLLAVFGC